MQYFVSVGNIGNIDCKNKTEALKTFQEYVKQSKQEYGRGSMESVTLFHGGDIIKEYIGKIDSQ